MITESAFNYYAFYISLVLVILYFLSGAITAGVLLFKQWYDGIAITVEDLGMSFMMMLGGFFVAIKFTWPLICDYFSSRDISFGELVIFKGRKSARVLNELKNTD